MSLNCWNLRVLISTNKLFRLDYRDECSLSPVHKRFFRGQTNISVGQPNISVGQPNISVGQLNISVGQPNISVGQPILAQQKYNPT